MIGGQRPHEKEPYYNEIKTSAIVRSSARSLDFRMNMSLGWMEEKMSATKVQVF